MKRRSAALIGAIGLVLQLAWEMGALPALPARIAPALGLAVTVLLPGYAFVAMGLVPPGGLALAPAWALGFGVAWNALLVLATRMLGMPFTVLGPASLVTGALLWAAALMTSRRAAPDRADAGSRAAPDRTLAGSRAALVAVMLAAALAGLHAARLGAPIHYYSDSPDHIASVRRMLEHGDAFPRDAFFRDAGESGMDPRKGLWHPQVALIARLAAVDPIDAWRWLPIAIAPLFVLIAASFGWLAAGPAGAAATAWAAFVVGAGQIGWSPLRKAGFSTFLADALCLAAMVALIADLGSQRRSRIAAVVLALAAVATHVFSAFQLALTVGALALGIALRDRAWSATLRRCAGTAAWMALAASPYLLWRANQAFAPVNLIHTEPQGLLWIGDHVRVVSIGVLWDWMARLWVLFPLAWWPLWRHGRHHPAALYVLTTSIGIALVIFNPLAVAALEPRVGYLLMRVIWMAPLAPLLGLAAVAIPARWLEGGHRRSAALAAGVVLVALWPTARDAALALARPGLFAGMEAAASPLRWRPELEWMDRNLPPGRVVLSDPATSYAVPMMTRHYVVTLVDQHSSPNDSLGLTRILDARDALDPYASWALTRDVVRRYGADVIVLNRRFVEVPRFDYWAPSPSWYDRARARLDGCPAAFERVHDSGDFVVYRIHEAALDTLATPPPPRPFVVPFVSGRFPVARRLGEGSPVILRLMLEPRTLAPGDTLRGVAEWRALSPLPPGSWEVAVRFDRPLPGGLVPPAFAAKPLRKLLELARRERYRFRADHLPTAGTYGVDLWRPDQVVRDSFVLEVPRYAAEGVYAVEIKILRQPHYPNYRLSDYFLDHDYYSGTPMSSIRVVKRPPAAPGARSD